MEKMNDTINEKSRTHRGYGDTSSPPSSLYSENSFSQRHPRFPPPYGSSIDDVTDGQDVTTNLRYDSSLNLLTPAEHASKWTSIIRDWIQEILCLITCVLSLFGVILVLILSHDKPQPKLPFAISLNTVVSYLGVVYKATLLGAIASCIGQLKWCWFKNQRRGLQDFDVIDAVSRSPLSAFTIFFTFRPYKWIYVGAFAILLTAFSDPFLQQTISVPLVSISHDTAMMPRAQGYDAGAYLDDFWNDAIQGQLDFGLKAAMYQGLFAPDDSSDIQKYCPSGNCTFPVFDSLAFCSKCTNLTGSVKTNDNPLHDGTDGTNDANYTFNLPFVNPITINTLTLPGNTIGLGPALVSVPFPSNLSELALGVTNPLVAFSMLHWGTLDASMSARIETGNYSTQLPEAFQCALYFCLNTFQANVSGGMSQSNVISTYAPPSGTPYGEDISVSVSEFGNVSELVFTRPSSSPVKTGNNTFYVANGTVGVLGNYLTHFFYGYQAIKSGQTDLLDNFANNPNAGLGFDASAPPFINDTMSVFSSETWVDVPAIMDGMATTMTNYIRLAGTGQLQQDSFISGSSHNLLPLIRVDWRWLTFPATLIVFGIAFLIYTVLVSARLGVPVWKDGALAMLFHGLDENTSRALAVAQHGGGRSLTGREMSKMAKRTSVVLETRVNGEMKLVQ